MTKNEKFIEKSKLIHNNRYDYSNTNYINNKTKVEIICEKHGSFFQIPNSHKNGNGCSKCADMSTGFKKLNNNWLNDFIKTHGNMYDYTNSIYVNCRTKVEIICKEHGSFLQTPTKHKNGQGCYKCALLTLSNIKKKTKKDILPDFIKKHGNKYDYSKVDYINSNTKVEIICKKHGSFLQKPSFHKFGQGCPICKFSKGENKIMEILIEYSINFKLQHKFDDCRSIYPLTFDFFLPEHNMCIEYDGIQHFEPIDKWGGLERFEKQTFNDKIKNEYCRNNEIKLLRIPYTSFDKIESILNEIINPL